jgi:hypothetical protein
MSDNLNILETVTSAIQHSGSSAHPVPVGFQPPGKVSSSGLAAHSHNRRILLEPLSLEGETSRFASSEHQAFILEKQRQALKGVEKQSGTGEVEVVHVGLNAEQGKEYAVPRILDGVFDKLSEDKLGKRGVNRKMFMEVCF